MHDVIALCENSVPIVTEAAVEIDKPNMSLCCSGPDKCLIKSSRNDQNLYVTGENFSLLNILLESGKSDSDGGSEAIESGSHHQIIGCEFCNILVVI
jgi:hypothetical protein